MYFWKPYVSQADRKKASEKMIAKMRKRGIILDPVVIEGRTIAKSFWGKSWCSQFEGFSEYSNRLPRGRTYVRNGSVIDLKIEKCSIKSLVSGSEMYKVNISIKGISQKKWADIVDNCQKKVYSLFDLLQGKISSPVIKIVTDPKKGLFPLQNEIEYSCSCPDGVSICKHVAATLYGVGSHLDKSPELIFTLRGVDSKDLISSANVKSAASNSTSKIKTSDVSDLFGIDFDGEEKTPVKRTKTLHDTKKERKIEVEKSMAKKTPKNSLKGKSSSKQSTRCKSVSSKKK